MPKNAISAATRRAVIARSRGLCEYCRSRADHAMGSFAVEHIIPIVRGGSDGLGNLALACSGCNGHKYDKVEALDPVDKQMADLFHPRHQKWDEHFQWSEDFAFIVGVTSTGRATVNALHMNRTGLVNLRRALHIIGKHPPEFN